MDSVFQPEQQHQRVDSKIVATLERLTQALRVLLWEKAQQHGLSPIQIQILVFIANHSAPLRRVGHLAREFGMTAATISDAVSTLEEKQLLLRVTSAADRRAMDLKLTPAGRRQAHKLSGWADSVREAIAPIPEPDKIVTLNSLMSLIYELQKSGTVTVARMCLSCRHFVQSPDATSPHFCNLLNKSLVSTELRVDCAEHEPAH